MKKASVRTSGYVKNGKTTAHRYNPHQKEYILDWLKRDIKRNGERGAIPRAMRHHKVSYVTLRNWLGYKAKDLVVGGEKAKQLAAVKQEIVKLSKELKKIARALG